MELCQGVVRLGVQKRFLARGQSGMEQAAQGTGHGPKLMEFKERLENSLRLFGFDCWAVLYGARS